MIGIGITTFNRPQHLELCLKNIGKHTTKPFDLFVYEDIDKKGIAFGKNECLKALKKNDYIVLLDDDCFPIKDGWVEFFIQAHKRTGQHHFLYLKETIIIKKMGQQNGINIYDNCGGCFLFLTKQVIEKVGGYCKEYGRYGFEHAGYTHRIHQAGLTPAGLYLSPPGIEDYIFSLDYDYDPKYDYLCHHSSFQDEISKIPEYINQNRIIYQKDIQTIYQPL